MSFPVVTMKENSIEISRKSVLMYLGFGDNEPDDTTNMLVSRGIKMLSDVSDFRACLTVVPITVFSESVEFPTFRAESLSLVKNLSDCKQAVVFSATIGIEADRLIQRMSLQSQSQGVIINAVGSAAVEAWCDEINERLKREYLEKNKILRPRFSPGYGDFDIKHQKDVLSLCQSDRKIGVCLTQSLMMLPTKSVSAVIGISDEEKNLCSCKCDFCSQKNCIYGMR